MKQLSIVIIFLLYCFYGFTQEKSLNLKLGAFGGYASYSFDYLKDVNAQAINQLPFDAAVTDDFPSRVYFGGSVLLRLTNWYYIGPAYEFHSTGSRLGAKDYSGIYSFDQILTTHQLGIENEIRISKGLKPAVFFDITGGVNFSAWKMNEVLDVSGSREEDKSDFASIKPFVLPVLKLSYPVCRNISAFAKGGYLVDAGGKYHLKSNKDAQSEQKIPWNGFRISAGLELNVK